MKPEHTAPFIRATTGGLASLITSSCGGAWMRTSSSSTQNARDFRKLVGAEDLHPGLIILPAVGRERSWILLLSVLEAITELGVPAVVMINHVAEIDEQGRVQLFELPAARI